MDNKETKNLIKIIFNLKQELATCKSKYASYEEETNDKISNLENLLADRKQELKEKINRIKELEYDLSVTIERHEKAIIASQKTIAKLRDENYEIRKDKYNKEKKLATANKKINALEKELEALRDKNI